MALLTCCLVSALLPMFTIFAEAQDGSFRWPRGCSPKSCDYVASWEYNESREVVVFTIRAKVGVGVWASIGFSKDRRMEDSDAVVGWQENDGTPVITDRYLVSKSPNQVSQDEKNDIQLLSLQHRDMYLTFSFARPRDTGDKAEDISLTDCVYFLYCWGGFGIRKDRITIHSQTHVSESKICIGPGEPSGDRSPFVTTEKFVPEGQDVGSRGLPLTPISSGRVQPALEPHTSSDSSYRWPKDCLMNRCDYAASWKYDNAEKQVIFIVRAKVERGMWVGIGFSDTNSMDASDAVVGWMANDGSPVLTDRYLSAKNQRSVNVDSKEDVKPILFTHREGYLMYSFSREIDTGDKKEDLSLAKCLYFIYAWGGFGISRNTITMHRNQFTSGTKICIGPQHAPPSTLPTFSPSVTRPPIASPHYHAKPLKCHEMECPQYSVCMEGRCICISGYEQHSGGICKPKIVAVSKPCLMKLCSRRKKCIVKQGVGVCQCKAGYREDPHGICILSRPASFPGRYNPCENIDCGENAHCKAEHGSGECFCDQGYTMDGQTCRLSWQEDACDQKTCTQYSYCINGKCLCRTGYSRDSDGLCRRKPVKNPCLMRRCSSDKKCVVKHGVGVCQCKYGYKEDRHGRCLLSRSSFFTGQYDPCERVDCWANSYCKPEHRLATCVCDAGFTLVGASCQHTPQRMLCNGRKCYEFAHCDAGRCRCNDGYYEHGGRCNLKNPCWMKRCSWNRKCIVKDDIGTCQCRIGYREGPHGNCMSSGSSFSQGIHDPCERMICRPNSYCKAEHGLAKCVCDAGFKMVGTSCSDSTTNPCDLVRCSSGRICVVKNNEAKCQCKDRYYEIYGTCRILTYLKKK